jgi:hypothetical protein
MKRLANFINDHADEIIAEWESFAESLPPATAGKMSRKALLDHSREILAFIAKDISSTQSDAEQKTKSHGGNLKPAFTPETAAEIHGALRLEDGFDVMQMASEYRALRASVIRLWIKKSNQMDESQLLDLIRFNESVDQALAESIAYFTKSLDASKEKG